MQTMFRINGFFEIKEDVTEAQIKSLSDESVEKLLKDEVNHGHDIFHSTTRPPGVHYMYIGRVVGVCKKQQ